MLHPPAAIPTLFAVPCSLSFVPTPNGLHLPLSKFFPRPEIVITLTLRLSASSYWASQKIATDTQHLGQNIKNPSASGNFNFPVQKLNCWIPKAALRIILIITGHRTTSGFGSPELQTDRVAACHKTIVLHYVTLKKKDCNVETSVKYCWN
jgi:hypothetical protein